MKHTLLFTFSLLLLTSLAAVVQQPVELPPFTFAGRIVDYAHVAYDADTTVEVRVKAKDGTLLGKTTTATCGNTAFNYSVDIPIATQSISRSVKTGDKVDF